MSLFERTTDPPDSIWGYTLFTLKVFPTKQTKIKISYDFGCKFIDHSSLAEDIVSINVTPYLQRHAKYKQDIQSFGSYAELIRREGLWGAQKLCVLLCEEYSKAGCPPVKGRHYGNADMEWLFTYFTERGRTLERTAAFKEELLATA